MLILVATFCYYSIFQITKQPVLIDLKDEINILPVKIITGNNCYYYSDLVTNRVICFDLNAMKHQVGGIGQGPGEYEGRIEIEYSNNHLYIFERIKNKLLDYDCNGKLLNSLKFQIEQGSAFLSSDLIAYKDHFYLVKNLTDDWVCKFDKTGAHIQTFRKGLPDPYGKNGFNYLAISSKNDILTFFSRFTGELLQLDLKTGRTSKKSSIDDPLNNEGLNLFLSSNKYQPGQGLHITLRFMSILRLNNTDMAVYRDKDPAEKMKLLFEIPSSKRHYLDTSNIPFDVEFIYQVESVLFLLSTDGDLYWVKSDAVRMKKT